MSLDFARKIDKGHEEIVAVAKATINASNVTCSRLFWKEMEHYFPKYDVDYLRKYLDFVYKEMSMCQNPSFSGHPTLLSDKSTQADSSYISLVQVDLEQIKYIIKSTFLDQI